MDKDTITTIWARYERGLAYNQRLNLYATVKKNNRFYSGDQWNGLTLAGLPAPVFNLFKRVANYKIATIMSQRVTMKFSVENIETDSEDPRSQELQQKAELLSKHSEIKWEKLKIDSLIREVLLDGFNSGDMCFYTYWDKEIDTNQTYGAKPQIDEAGQPILDETGQPQLEQVPIMGDFITEIIDGTNVMFGNPNNRKVKGQPYILIHGRALVSDLRAEAKANGVPDEMIANITSDVNNGYTAGDKGSIEITNTDDDSAKCSYIIQLRMDKETKTVWLSKSTRAVDVIKEKDMQLKKYPLDWSNWDSLKDCYHGQAESTGLIQNQILINKMYALVCKWTMDMAFGRTAFDKNRVKSVSNAVGVSIPIDGDITGAIQQIQPAQMNTVILTVMDKIVDLTLQMLGATDTALGNSAPDNYKALVANQQQANIPLENVKANIYQLVQDLGLTWLDFMLSKYNVPRKLAYKEKDKSMQGEFDGSQYKDENWGLKIDVGPSSYWSEMASVETLSNLYREGKITDIQFFERLPDGYIIDKQGIIDDLKKMMQQQAQQMAQQQQVAGQEQQAGSQMQQLQHEKMAQFVESLPPDVQQKLKEMPDNQYQQVVQSMMMQSQQQQQQQPQQ